jgi:hypothetical protein
MRTYRSTGHKLPTQVITYQPFRYVDRRGLAADCPTCIDGNGGRDATCCGQPNSIAGLNRLGGTVMCCAGRKVACTNIGGPEPARSILRKCAQEHEDRHVPDTVCRDCFSVHRAVFREGITRRQGACAAFNVEMKCLLKAGPACGANGDCRDAVRNELTFMNDYGNMFFNCGFYGYK